MLRVISSSPTDVQPTLGGHNLIRSVVWLLATYQLVSFALFEDLLLRPAASTARRLAGILLDLGALSYCMHVGGGHTTGAPCSQERLKVLLDQIAYRSMI